MQENITHLYFLEQEYKALSTKLYYDMPKKYFDFASTTPVYKEVVDIINEQLKYNFGNPSSLTSRGIDAKNCITQSVDLIKKILKASKYNFYTTSGATESNNWVASILQEGDNVITTSFEHPSVLNTLQHKKVNIIFYNPNEAGEFDIEELKLLIKTYEPKLVSIMAVNNETGLILPIEEISKECRGKTLLHCDLTQAIPHCLVDCDSLNCDFYSFSGHKFGAPKGIGGFLVKKKAEKFVKPYIYGGHQQNSQRAGTENVAYISGMAQALKMTAELIKFYHSLIVEYQKYFIENFKKALTKTQIKCIIINELENSKTLFVPSIVNICFKDINGYTLMKMLDLVDIAVSTGSACSADYSYVSPALKLFKVPEDYIHGSIRISFGFGTIKEDIDYLIDRLIGALQQLEGLK